MIALYLKEVNSFLDSLTAYIVIGVFLLFTGLYTWVFPDQNVLDYGFATMDVLFNSGPYILLFIIPAITMKSFAEERKTGTYEILFTKPLSDMQIILAKYLATYTLSALAILPTLVYAYSIYELGSPKGNLDIASVAGSYVGLLLLAALFTALGIMASAITDNQIVAYIIAVFLCYMFYTGFDTISTLDVFFSQSLLIKKLGIMVHYDTLSRGLIDMGDVLYFVSAIIITLHSVALYLSHRAQ
ncbi:MAG: gliding motility-associated ABC transporter permease subunit GldF [Cytophagales bacterium]|nr:gliding motility-associated ABC transporter permease subunit GldF [Cytophagales bacterium]